MKTIGGVLRQSIVFSFRPAIVDCNVLAFDVAGFLQPLAEGGREMCERARRGGAEEPNHGHRFLRARCARPRDRCAAKQRDEVTPCPCITHSITSSARPRSVRGNVRPSAFAVLGLMIN